MKFHVISSRVQLLRPKALNEAFLLTNNWDDWFKYETLYTLFYYDGIGVQHEVGGVKIGQFNIVGKKPDLQPEFTSLSKNLFFSVGQDDYYYERLNKLGDAVRDEILNSLNDFAKDIELFQLAKAEDVTKDSLLRFISETTVLGQFKRLAEYPHYQVHLFPSIAGQYFCDEPAVQEN